MKAPKGMIKLSNRLKKVVESNSSNQEKNDGTNTALTKDYGLSMAEKPRLSCSMPSHSSSAIASGVNTVAPDATSNTIQPHQFSRALALLNAMVQNEQLKAETKDGRSKESGFVTQWIRGYEMDERSIPQQEVFRLQPLWILADEDSISLIDFNGSEQHGNYEVTVSSYVEMLLSKKYGYSPNCPQKSNRHVNDRMLECEKQNFVARLSVDFSTDFRVSSKIEIAPRAFDAIIYYLDSEKKVFSTQPLKHAQSAAHFFFAKPKGVVVVIRSRIVVRSILEEMTNGFLPPFLEKAYPFGVRIEGKLLSTAPLGSASGATPFLWRPLLPSKSEEALASAQVWRDLFPAAESEQHAIAYRQLLGSLCIPLSVIDEIQLKTIDEFPKYNPVGSTRTEKMNVSDGNILLSSNISSHEREIKDSPIQYFTGTGSRIGGKLTEKEARARFHAQADTSASIANEKASDALHCFVQGEVRSNQVTYVAPLFSSGPDYGSMLSVIHSNSTAKPPLKVNPPILCSSIHLLTPLGRVTLERNIPASTASFPPSPSVAATKMILLKDCRESLLRSAVGRSMRLAGESIRFRYAPGLPFLGDNVIISQPAVILRLSVQQQRNSALKQPLS